MNFSAPIWMIVLGIVVWVPVGIAFFWNRPK
jgi:hypothetical protein